MLQILFDNFKELAKACGK